MKEKEVWVTYLLWFFLGLLGVHKFYLGKIGWGILYIFTRGIFFDWLDYRHFHNSTSSESR